MSARHELCAAAMRQYGTDPDGVERAMRAAGYSATTAYASRDVYADFLRLHGYDVDGPAGAEAPGWATAMLKPLPTVEPEWTMTAPDPAVVDDRRMVELVEEGYDVAIRPIYPPDVYVVRSTAEPTPSEPVRTTDAQPEPAVARPKRGRPRKG